VQAITDIQADPVGFLMRMVEALKAGFQGFLDMRRTRCRFQRRQDRALMTCSRRS
jgi:hypothetical protein